MRRGIFETGVGEICKLHQRGKFRAIEDVTFFTIRGNVAHINSKKGDLEPHIFFQPQFETNIFKHFFYILS